jgi:GT2 family glycosyltransferase
VRWLIWKLLLLLSPSVRLKLWRGLVLLPRPLRQKIWQALVRREHDSNDLASTWNARAPAAAGLARLDQPIPRSYDLLFWVGADAPWPGSDREGAAREFGRRGHRVFVLSRARWIDVGAPHVLDEGIFEIPVPSGALLHEIVKQLGDRLRYDYGVIDAVILGDGGDDDAMRAIANRFGWHILDTLPDASKKPNDGSAARWAALVETADACFPLVSILVVTYNNLAYNRLCLNSILDKTSYPNLEIVVVDNASTDGTREFLDDFSRVNAECRVVANTMNEGFARANNHGARVARGQYLVFLNNDTVVTRPWVSSLIRGLRDPAVGLVGPLSSRRGDESGIETAYSTFEEMDRFAETYVRAHEGKRFEASRIVFFCAAMRRSVFDEIGDLDERFGMGMFEDDDYAERLRRAGYQIVYVEDGFVHHWGNASFSRLDVAEYLKLIDANRAKFEAKWGVKWAPRRTRH